MLFQVVLEVQEENVGPLLAVVTKSRLAVSMMTAPVEEPGPSERQHKKKPKNGRKTRRPPAKKIRQNLSASGMSREEVVLKALGTKEVRAEAIGAELEEYGFSGKAVHTALNKMIQKGQIIRVEAGTYRRK